MKARTTLTVEKELLEKAHERGVNISRLLEESLRVFLDGGSQQSMPQPAQPLEKASPTANPTDILPNEMLEELKARIGREPSPDQIKRVITGIWSIVTELELIDDVTP